jgi:hypothetical protein
MLIPPGNFSRAPMGEAPIEQERPNEGRKKEGTNMSSSLTTVTDFEAIAQTVQRYVDGGRSGRSADMKAAFHPGATIFGYIGSDLLAGPIQMLFDWNDQNGPATGLQARLASIEIGGTIATARLELDNWTGHRFTDMFTLLQVDGEWKIISKVFYLHP